MMWGLLGRSKANARAERKVVASITKLETEARDDKASAQRYKKALEEIKAMTSWYWGVMADVNKVATRTLEVGDDSMV